MFEPHQESLFPHSTHEPLASRIRPQTIDAIVGQEHLLGKGKALRRLIDRDDIPSMILWGPPGVGKTTLVLSNSVGFPLLLFACQSLYSATGIPFICGSVT